VRLRSLRPSLLLAAATALAATLAVACGGAVSEDPQPPAGGAGQPIDREFVLGVGRSAEVRGTGLVIAFRGVEHDDRCPLDVQCVQAGEARAAFAVARAAGGDTTVVLGTRPGTETAAVGTWRIELRSLAPVPAAGAPTPPERYEATLEVSRE
jgi:hypothetical protein